MRTNLANLSDAAMWKIRRARFARNRQKSVRSLRDSVKGPFESKRAFSLPETLSNRIREWSHSRQTVCLSGCLSVCQNLCLLPRSYCLAPSSLMFTRVYNPCSSSRFPVLLSHAGSKKLTFPYVPPHLLRTESSLSFWGLGSSLLMAALSVFASLYLTVTNAD